MALMSQMALFLEGGIGMAPGTQAGCPVETRPKQGREGLFYEPPCPSPGQLPP